MDAPGPIRPSAGLSFDEFALGQTYASPARTVTEADIAAFAAWSGDWNPLHTDEEFARRTPFRGRVAHGLLIQSISTGLASRMGIFDGTIAALAGMRLEFVLPVRAGDTVRLELEVREMDPEPSRRRGWIRFGTRILNQLDEIVIDGEWRAILLRKRPAPERVGPDGSR